MGGIMFLLRRRKTESSISRQPDSSTTIYAPVHEYAEQVPPPYTSTSTPHGHSTVIAPTITPRETPSQDLLDPTLNFTAAQMEQQWRAKDKIFARAVVQFIAERFDGNLKGWGGYKYTYISEVHLKSFSLGLLMRIRTKILRTRKVDGTIFWGIMLGHIVEDLDKSAHLQNEILKRGDLK
jgi:hypothetical protein